MENHWIKGFLSFILFYYVGISIPTIIGTICHGFFGNFTQKHIGIIFIALTNMIYGISGLFWFQASLLLFEVLKNYDFICNSYKVFDVCSESVINMPDPQKQEIKDDMETIKYIKINLFGIIWLYSVTLNFI